MQNTQAELTAVQAAGAWRDFIAEEFANDPEGFRELLALAEQELEEAIAKRGRYIDALLVETEV
ncbi:hypothetical protein LGH70_06525 [Hymenobacter sp. BT635]|uniref:Uncharacterized protein n=1 Tax=Hymenobacter nitidus TaxID=2880929 RepID=A0ABS8ADY3_9BACT|nr:hypothetical protein [Hymenobacter nitidus]MCB2377229.1 hypothetical protein [Hymenobacter nitidus]